MQTLSYSAVTLFKDLVCIHLTLFSILDILIYFDFIDIEFKGKFYSNSIVPGGLSVIS